MGYSWEEAWEIAIDIFGYPCSCPNCSDDGGKELSEQVFSLTKELSGLDYPPDNWRG